MCRRRQFFVSFGGIIFLIPRTTQADDTTQLPCRLSMAWFATQLVVVSLCAQHIFVVSVWHAQRHDKFRFSLSCRCVVSSEYGSAFNALTGRIIIIMRRALFS